VIDSNVARRYARALLALAGTDPGKLQDLAQQLTVVAQGFAGNPQTAVLLTPGAPKATQLAMIESLAPKLDKTAVDMLRLLVDRARFDGLAEIAHSFSALVDEKLGRVRAIVTSAAPLAADELQKVAAQLTKATGKQITLETKVDPALLGGISADVGGVLFDGSVRTQLEKLRQELKSPQSA
jgi:F-type H+-transporting ATPase subunit delta